MKKLNKKQKIIILIAIVAIVVIVSLIIGANVLKINLSNNSYGSANNNSGSGNLLPEYIKAGITLGGVTGTLESLDTSDATATAADIIYGKTAYVKGQKITGTKDIEYPEVSFSPNGNTTWSKSQSTVITVSDNLTSTNNIQIKYVWSTSETAPSFANAQTATSGQTITNNTRTGRMYLYVQAIDSQGNTTVARSNLFYIDNTAPVINKIYSAYKMFEPADTTNVTYKNYTSDSDPLGTMTTATTDPQILISELTSYKNINQVIICFNGGLLEDLPVQIFYAKQGEELSETNSIITTIPQGRYFMVIDIPNGNYETIRVDIGKKAGISYGFGYIELVADNGTNHKNNIRIRFNVEENDSGIKEIQQSTDKNKWESVNYSSNETEGVRIIHWYNEKIDSTYYYRIIDNVGNISEPTEGVAIKMNQ